MAIGIISAMSEEIDQLLDEMTDTKTSVSAGRTYYQGKIQGKEVIIAFSRWGKVAASITATDMIRSFDIDQILFVGVAGAVSDQLHIGDIVIGTELYQHDMNAAPIFPEYEIPLTGISSYKTDQDKTEKLVAASNSFLAKFDIPTDLLDSFSINIPRLYKGTIASADQFVSSERKRNELLSKNPELLCVEMEGAAVAQVCHEFNVPYSIVRIISDNADHSAAVDFEKFVKDIASNYSLRILKNYIS